MLLILWVENIFRKEAATEKGTLILKYEMGWGTSTLLHWRLILIGRFPFQTPLGSWLSLVEYVRTQWLALGEQGCSFYNELKWSIQIVVKIHAETASFSGFFSWQKRIAFIKNSIDLNFHYWIISLLNFIIDLPSYCSEKKTKKRPKTKAVVVSIWKLNYFSKTVISKTAWINAWIHYRTYLKQNQGTALSFYQAIYRWLVCNKW